MIGRWVRVQPQERRTVAAACALLMLAMAAHVLIETARDALFLEALPVERLPWVYLALALLGPLATLLPLQGGGRRMLALTLGFAGLGAMGFWAGLLHTGPLGRAGLYLWSALTCSVVVLQSWHLLSTRFTVDAAKRVFGLIGAGAVTGAILGAVLGGALSQVMHVRHLLLAAAVLYLSSMLVLPALGEAKGPKPRRSLPAPIAELRKVTADPYTSRLLGFVCLATLAFTLVDFLFKQQVAANVAPEALGTTFASFYAVVNVLALGVQLAFTGAAIRELGVRRALVVLPSLLVAGAVAVVAGGGLVAAMGLKAAEAGLKHTLHRTTMEVLFVPVSEAQRARLRRVSDLLVHRVSQGFASVLLLGILALGGGTAAVAILVGVLAIAWLGLAASLREHYLALFRGVLKREGALDLSTPNLDLSALEALLEAINSESEDEVITAMELLASHGRARLIPSLILYHPATRVVVRALDIFGQAGREDHLPKAERLAEVGPPGVRAAVLRSHPNRGLALRAATDPHPIVRCTALTALLADGGPQAASVEPVVLELAANGSLAERIALAQALAGQSLGPIQRSILTHLAGSPEGAVRGALAHSLRVAPSIEHMDVLLTLLPSRHARADARGAIVACGSPALERLGQVLCDPAAPERVRIHIPAVLSALPSPETAQLLCERLVQEPKGVLRFRILRALNRLARRAPDIRLPRAPLRQSLHDAIATAWQQLDWSLRLAEAHAADPGKATTGGTLLVRLMRDKRTNGRERMFRQLDLLHPKEDFEQIYMGLLSKRDERRASSLELLDNVLSQALRTPILALVDPAQSSLARSVRMAAAEGFYTPRQTTYPALVAELVRDGNGSLKAIAAWHAAELDLYHLLPELVAIDLSAQAESAPVIEQAIAKLRLARAEVAR